MSPLIDVALRISAILGAGLLLRAIVRRHSPALRHFVLATAILAAPAVVPLGSLLPAVPVPVPYRPAVHRLAPAQRSRDARPAGMIPAAPPDDAGQVSAALAAPPPATFDVVAIASAIWLAGAAFGLLVLAIGLWRLAGVTSDARATDGVWADTFDALRAEGLAPAAARLRIVAEPTLLATWGWRRPVVLVPETALAWPADRVRLVLRHELAHVARADWLVQLYADALRALLWWTPLIWIACRQLRHDSELACDDAVLASGVNAHAYADHLVAIARACGPARQAAATPMAHPSTLHRRIVAMLNPRLDRPRPTRRAAILISAALVVAAVLPAAVLRGAQAGPQPLEGVIYDPSGAVLAGVAVTLAAGPSRQDATTDAAGHFRFESVAPGAYTLETGLPGFKKLREPMTLKADADWNRAVTLQIGDLQESISVREHRVGPPAPAGAGPARVRVGGNIRVPTKTLDKRPVYPPSMVEAGREGVVPIEATIGVDGSVTMVRVASTQVHPDFAIAAVDAVRQWRYTPTLLNGRPVQVVMTVKVAFTLE
jgi:TonB family protein